MLPKFTGDNDLVILPTPPWVLIHASLPVARSKAAKLGTASLSLQIVTSTRAPITMGEEDRAPAIRSETLIG